eukprot:TRINITY_DN27847_c0_g1_i1.p1 TRINITY_DN27847_c0_g1~~TRINITY_DN27847_c0_g1_i1.p1  ORF type:complete len:187 (-),score=29.50 TRINITY_DN27847_c0_g1_i1:94-654(-)
MAIHFAVTSLPLPRATANPPPSSVAAAVGRLVATSELPQTRGSQAPLVAGLASCTAALGLRSLSSRRWGHSRTFRRAVDLPVREPEIKTTVAIPGAVVKEETRQKRADEYRLLLFNDPLNKREFVARQLMTICLLKEGDAFEVMMKAHREGVAVVGTYSFETAEAYCEALTAQGLQVDIIPVDKSE